MQTNIEETFEIQAPVDEVWAFLMDPQQVAACMPGAELDAIEDEQTFVGTIKLKVGFVGVGYKIRVRFTEVDAQSHTARLEAQGKETVEGGGIAKGTMVSRSKALPDGGTEVTVEVAMEISGRMMEYGKGMFRSVSRQLTKKFVACAKEKLESSEVQSRS